jgi:hypothetical protein
MLLLLRLKRRERRLCNATERLIRTQPTTYCSSVCLKPHGVQEMNFSHLSTRNYGEDYRNTQGLLKYLSNSLPYDTLHLTLFTHVRPLDSSVFQEVRAIL